MTIHTLEREKHQDFLKQERIDPITGDLLKENDKIVICASCKSAFLVDSWEYMNEEHCEQTHTLREIPKSEIVKMEKSIFIDFLELKTCSNFDAAQKAASPYTLSGFVFFALLYNFGFIELLAINFAHFVSWLFIFVFYAESSYKKLIKIKNNTLIFNKSNESLGSVKIDDIISLQIEKPKRFFFSNMIGRLYKYDKNMYNLKITDSSYSTHNILLYADQLELINTKTNLLTKFNKNSILPLPINPKIEQNIV
ncbi:hypothetical protein Fleli_4049 [Bernardetia litoralis DSM 6794]|uniref:Uncharacterized protein n=1 Tax=Bernardetia litoralis (strain ATCC 23117 / DSM 6794 / NBRC 15988 / NCIMB 1366 / Fx l1 / Sio-4) TaxID=880071 RepID=I4AQW0_BERLS|nr:hypothetical protein [Bernardetia litoralis]AFM06345.1 hypothetical protein Fleli_4049 [Bernardetia litoralis DSM 6794]